MGTFWNSKQSHAADTELSGDEKTLEQEMKKEIRRRCHNFHQEQQMQLAAAEQVGEAGLSAMPKKFLRG